MNYSAAGVIAVCGLAAGIAGCSGPSPSALYPFVSFAPGRSGPGVTPYGGETNLAPSTVRTADFPIIDDVGDGGTSDLSGPQGGVCPGRVVQLDSIGGRWTTTQLALSSGFQNAGIHTFWSNQDLLLRVRGNCKAGMYYVFLTAKNTKGPRPAWYEYFHLSVLNENDGHFLTNLFLKASDGEYHRAKAAVYLPLGDTALNLLWDNDARDPDGSDANIQIRNVELTPAPASLLTASLARKGRDVCGMTGRWFFTEKGALTFWSDQTASYCYGPEISAGRYELAIEAVNHGRLPPMYQRFRFYVVTLAGAANLEVPADDVEPRSGRALIDLPRGPLRLSVTWLNDHWDARGYDTNVEVIRLALRRVGDAEPGLLLRAAPESGPIRSQTVLLVLGALAGIAACGLFVWNWLRRTM